MNMHNPNNDTLRQLESFNKWLTDIYSAETSFTTLLIDSGFSEAETEQIKQEHLSKFLQGILNLMASYSDLSSPERNMLMLLHYGLLDGNPQDFKTMGDWLGVGPSRMRQLVEKRMDLYRNPERQAKFQNDIAAIAQRLLDRENKIED